MIRIGFDPDQLPPDKKAEWDAWVAKAEKATEAAIAAWEAWRGDSVLPGTKFKHDFNEAIWGELKDWLLENVFNRKCAYCETPVGRSVFHADHFRPKGRVTYRVQTQKALKRGTCLDPLGQTIEHPGYFWLAYNWWNLLPACALCNSGEGKKDQFPVDAVSHVLVQAFKTEELAKLLRKPQPSPKWKSFVYLNPLDLDTLENPKLLHPYVDDPAQHLVFGDAGTVSARNNSPKGEESIKVYDLAADGLCRARQAAQDTARTLYYAAMAAQPPGTPIPQIRANARQAVMVFISPTAAYSSAVRDYLDLLS